MPMIMTVPARRELAVDGQTLVLRRAELGEIIDLRHRVLRAGLPRETAVFAGDEMPTSLHVGAFADARTVCCATFHLSRWQDEPAWQLRGMATDDLFRGKGVGRALLALAEQMLCDAGPIRQLWANARVPAVGFYQSLGWEVVSPEFEIPTAGPHHQIAKKL
jgi:GNAT superfamily N-acetyltransferase